MMRRVVLLAAILLLAPFQVPAQVQEGDFEIDADASLDWFEMAIDDGESNSSVGGRLTGKVGHYFSDGFDFGGFFGLSYRDLEEDSRSYALSVGPALGWHFRSDTRIVPFAAVGAGIVHRKSEFDDGRNSTIDVTDLGWAGFLSGGVDLFVSPDIAVKLQLRYDKEDIRYERQFRTPAGFQRMEADITREQISLTAGLAFFSRRGRPAARSPETETGGMPEPTR